MSGMDPYRRKSWRSAAVALAALLPAVRADPAPTASGAGTPVPSEGAVDLAAPRWTQGDTWTLKVTYSPLALGKEARAEEEKRRREQKGKLGQRDQALTAYWIYKVTSVEEKSDGRQLSIVQVKDKDGERGGLGSFLFGRRSEDGGERFGLLEAKLLVFQGGEPTMERVRFGDLSGVPKPVLPVSGAIPHEFPSLPFAAPAGHEVTWFETRGEGDLRFAFDVVQTGRSGVKASEIAGRPELAATLNEAGLPTEGLTVLEARRAFDGGYFRQIWAPGYPWAIYGETAAWRYHLVYDFYREGRGARSK